MSARIRLLSAEKYIKLLKEKALVTLDCTWYPAGKDGYQEYVTEHISGARYFPFTELKSESPYPHMLPTDFQNFASGASKLGLKRSDYVVVYDQATYLSAPRVAWLLSTFGHPNVYLLDSFKKYKSLGGPIERGESPQAKSTTYLAEGETAPSKIGSWLNYEDIVHIVESGGADQVNLIDARGAARFSGAQDEPRPGILSGHIPGSKNIPFSDVVQPDGHFKSKDQLDQLLESHQIDPTKRTIVLCGSGVTACVVKAALDEAYGTSAEIYDGSWSEWGQRAPAHLVEKSA